MKSHRISAKTVDKKFFQLCNNDFDERSDFEGFDDDKDDNNMND